MRSTKPLQGLSTIYLNPDGVTEILSGLRHSYNCCVLSRGFVLRTSPPAYILSHLRCSMGSTPKTYARLFRMSFPIRHGCINSVASVLVCAPAPMKSAFFVAFVRFGVAMRCWKAIKKRPCVMASWGYALRLTAEHRWRCVTPRDARG